MKLQEALTSTGTALAAPDPIQFSSSFAFPEFACRRKSSRMTQWGAALQDLPWCCTKAQFLQKCVQDLEKSCISSILRGTQNIFSARPFLSRCSWGDEQGTRPQQSPAAVLSVSPLCPADPLTQKATSVAITAGPSLKAVQFIVFSVWSFGGHTRRQFTVSKQTLKILIPFKILPPPPP